jgi:hypothetical protein
MGPDSDAPTGGRRRNAVRAAPLTRIVRVGLVAGAVVGDWWEGDFSRPERPRRGRSLLQRQPGCRFRLRLAEKRPRSARASPVSPLALRAPSEPGDPFSFVMDTLLDSGACCPNQLSNETLGRGTSAQVRLSCQGPVSGALSNPFALLTTVSPVP